MSTGLDCRFIEVAPDEWYYQLEQYQCRDCYDSFGPFPSFDAAYSHLHKWNANPGGYSQWTASEQEAEEWREWAKRKEQER